MVVTGLGLLVLENNLLLLVRALVDVVVVGALLVAGVLLIVEALLVAGVLLVVGALVVARALVVVGPLVVVRVGALVVVVFVSVRGGEQRPWY